MPTLGATELIVILVIILLLFGVNRLPDVGRSLGQGIREFKENTKLLEETERHLTEEIDVENRGSDPKEV